MDWETHLESRLFHLTYPKIFPKIFIDNDCNFGNNLHIGAIGEIIIKSGVLGGSNILIIDHNHGETLNLSEISSIQPSQRELTSTGNIYIGENVWLADNVKILGGSVIESGSIIAANAVVKGKVREIPSIMDTSDAIQIDVIIPVLNEQEYILSCLNSVCNFVLPKNVNLQIFVIDGCSKDETLRIALEFAADKDNIFILNNPGIIQATALNIGIKQSKADYILRLDAHSEYPSDYLANCLETALRTSACNVGGMAITKASSSSLSATLVQAISTSKFGVGDSGFRVGAEEGVRDTVPYGFFKREIFNKYGLFNERLARAQDYEFNKRIQNEGGKKYGSIQKYTLVIIIRVLSIVLLLNSL